MLLTFLLFPILAVLALPAKRAPITPEGNRELTCLSATKFQPAQCSVPISACLDSPVKYTNPWSVAACVAAATCLHDEFGYNSGPGQLLTRINCAGPVTGTIVDGTKLPNLDYALFSRMAGGCQDAKGGCFFTQQNYIDFYFGVFTAAKATSYPNADYIVKNFWKYLIDWTKTSNNQTPYTNLNDFLHFYSVIDPVSSQIDLKSCEKITASCISQVDNTLTDPFSHVSCVLGAVCSAFTFDTTVTAFLNYVQKQKDSSVTTVQSAQTKPRVAHAVFVTLANKGTAVTLQSLTDAYYSEAASLGGPYPINPVYLNYLFGSLTSWTGQCKGVAESNLGDFYQYSSTIKSNIKC